MRSRLCKKKEEVLASGSHNGGPESLVPEAMMFKRIDHVEIGRCVRAAVTSAAFGQAALPEHSAA